jgi:hypothetical protein
MANVVGRTSASQKIDRAYTELDIVGDTMKKIRTWWKQL